MACNRFGTKFEIKVRKFHRFNFEIGGLKAPYKLVLFLPFQFPFLFVTSGIT
jgi:hypothetical protein